MLKQLDNPRIGVKEAIAVTALFIGAKAFLSYQVPLYHYGASATWMIPILQVALAFAALYPLLWLLDRHPGKNIIQIGHEMIGPYGNAALSAFFVVILIALTGITLREFGERVVSGFLPDTPISMAVLLFIVASTVIAFLGFDAIARLAYIFGIAIAVGYIVLTGLSIPFWRLDAVFPLGGMGAKSIITGAVITSGDMVEIFILGLIISFVPRNAIRKISYWSIGIAGVLLTSSTLAALLVFTYPVVSEINIPTLLVSRIINIGRFLQRMEVIFAPVWMLSALAQISLGIYLISSVTTYALRLPYNRPFILPAAVAVTALAFVPNNVAEALSWDIGIIRRYTFFAVGVPLVLLYGLTILRDRKGGDRAEKQHENS